MLVRPHTTLLSHTQSAKPQLQLARKPSPLTPRGQQGRCSWMCTTHKHCAGRCGQSTANVCEAGIGCDAATPHIQMYACTLHSFCCCFCCCDCCRRQALGRFCTSLAEANAYLDLSDVDQRSVAIETTRVSAASWNETSVWLLLPAASSAALLICGTHSTYY